MQQYIFMFGTYSQVVVSLQDAEVFVSLSPELERVSKDHGPFVVKRVWSQTVSGVNRFYNIASATGKRYSARVLYPLPSHGLGPQLKLFEMEWTNPTGKSLAPHLKRELYLEAIRALTKQGDFHRHEPTNIDEKLVLDFTQEILNLLGEPRYYSRQVQILAAWAQVVNGTNSFYHLKTGKGTLCSVNFFVSAGEKDSRITFFTKGLIDPTAVPPLDSTRDVLTLLNIGGFTAGPISYDDAVRVKGHTADFQKDSGELTAAFTVDRVWSQFVYGQNLFYNLTSSSKALYSVIVYVPSEGKSVVTYFTSGHKDPTKHQHIDLKADLENRISLGGYEKLVLSEVDEERVKRLTPQLNRELQSTANAYILDTAWKRTFPQGFDFFYNLVDQEQNFYSINVRVSLHESQQNEEITHSQRGYVFPQYANDKNRVPKNLKKVFVGQNCNDGESNEEVQKSIPVSWSFGGYNEVIPKDKELTASLNEKVKTFAGKTEKLQITREWEKVVDGTIRYYWLKASGTDTYSVSVLFPLENQGNDSAIVFYQTGEISPNSAVSQLQLSSSFGGFSDIYPTASDRSLLKANSSRIIEVSGEAAGTAFEIVRAWEQIVAGTNKFYHIQSSTKRRYSVKIFVDLDGSSEVTQLYQGLSNPSKYLIESSKFLQIRKEHFAKILFGGYKKAVVTQLDCQLIVKHRSDLGKLAGEQEATFSINAVWSQTLQGENRYYWLTSSHGAKYSAIINIPPLEQQKPSRVIELLLSYVSPDLLFGFDRFNTTTKDKIDEDILMARTKDMIEFLKSAQGPFGIRHVWLQKVSKTLKFNLKYLLQSKVTQRYYLAIIQYKSFKITSNTSLVDFVQILNEHLGSLSLNSQSQSQFSQSNPFYNPQSSKIQKLEGQFVTKDMCVDDIERVDQKSEQIMIEVGETDKDIFYYVPVKRWNQLLPDAVVNFFYWIKSSSGATFSILIITEPKSVRFCANGHPNPGDIQSQKPALKEETLPMKADYRPQSTKI